MRLCFALAFCVLTAVSVWAGQLSGSIAEADVAFHHSEPFAKPNKTPPGACLYATSPSVVRKHTVATTYARCKAGMWDEVIGRPRQGDELWLIVKLPGSFDPLAYQPEFESGRIGTEGKIDLHFLGISVLYASPMGQTEVHATIKVGPLQAKRYELCLDLITWQKTLDADSKVRSEAAKDMPPVTLRESLQVFPARAPAGKR